MCERAMLHITHTVGVRNWLRGVILLCMAQDEYLWDHMMRIGRPLRAW